MWKRRGSKGWGEESRLSLEAEAKKLLKKHEPEKDSILETQLIGIHERAR